MYEFTNTWFAQVAKATWDEMIPQLRPARMLEIGSYEGQATCYLIDSLAAHSEIEIHCVDSWDGGIEHREGGFDMGEVELRFLQKIDVAVGNAAHKASVIRHKGLSHRKLADLLSADYEGYFDFVYIDGSHQAPDVLCDAVMGFKLLKVGGVMVFDDYLWHENLPYGVDPLRCPKMAVDAFTNIFCRSIKILQAPLYQLIVRKIAA